MRGTKKKGAKRPAASKKPRLAAAPKTTLSREGNSALTKVITNDDIHESYRMGEYLRRLWLYCLGEAWVPDKGIPEFPSDAYDYVAQRFARIVRKSTDEAEWVELVAKKHL